MADRESTGTGGPTEPTTPTPTTKSTTGTTGSGAQDTVTGIKQTLGRATGDAADAAMSAGRDTIDSAQGRIRSLLEQQTDRAADHLGGVANALHKAAEQLDAENNGAVAQYAEQAADRVERVADLLRHSSLDDIVGEVEGFARRQPEVFIGGAFALGFLAARFIKSSSERRLNARTTGAAHSRAAATADRAARRTSDYRGDTTDRAMAGGIADSALRTPRRAADESVGTANSSLNAEPAGTPKPTVGMPLSRAPASVSGHAAPPTSTSTTVKPLGQRP